MEWHLSTIFQGSQPNSRYDLLILNQPLNIQAYKRVARHDGGANRLWDMLQDEKSLPFDRFPDAIVGDLDSLHGHVRDFFTRSGQTHIVHEPEQESTDFTKALRWLRKQHQGGAIDQRADVLTLGSLGGRVDQAFSTVHHLFKAADDGELLNGEIYLLSEQSLSFVLRKGRNGVHGLCSLVEGQRMTAENVGIIPLLGPAVISTKGLEWEVKEWRTEIGGQISTSNHIKGDVVEIETSDAVLFTVELTDALCA